MGFKKEEHFKRLWASLIDISPLSNDSEINRLLLGLPVKILMIKIFSDLSLGNFNLFNTGLKR